ncbi:MAG: RluA family pseudouridine synthase [Candidatus Bipolaricaulaceae bacterium]
MATKDAGQLQRFTVGAADGGQRVDQWVARRLGVPRTRARALVTAGLVRVDGRAAAPARRLRPGQLVTVVSPPPVTGPCPEIPILYADEAIAVVDKPAGLAVHPAGSTGGPTVVGCLAAELGLAGGSPGRPGVVHRLDALTSGVLLLARADDAYRGLVTQFRHRQVRKDYLAVVDGAVEVAEGEVRGRLARDRRRPWRVEVSAMGKDAATTFWLVKAAGRQTLLLVRPHTGRTHQIRVHLAAAGFPVVGDPLYGRGQGRLMLHALRLGFYHPRAGGWREVEAPPPPEFLPWLGEGSRPRPESSPPPPPRTGRAPMEKPGGTPR